MSETIKAWAKRLQDMFKLTIEKWQILFVFQNEVCWICKKPSFGRRLAVDHDWLSGECRGLLCHRCNTILGKIEKPGRSGQPWTMEELKRAVVYKENPPAREAWGAPHFGWPGSVTTKKHRKMLKRLVKAAEKEKQKSR